MQYKLEKINFSPKELFSLVFSLILYQLSFPIAKPYEIKHRDTFLKI